jgi:hypothetical protein
MGKFNKCEDVMHLVGGAEWRNNPACQKAHNTLQKVAQRVAPAKLGTFLERALPAVRKTVGAGLAGGSTQTDELVGGALKSKLVSAIKGGALKRLPKHLREKLVAAFRASSTKRGDPRNRPSYIHDMRYDRAFVRPHAPMYAKPPRSYFRNNFELVRQPHISWSDMRGGALATSDAGPYEASFVASGLPPVPPSALNPQRQGNPVPHVASAPIPIPLPAGGNLALERLAQPELHPDQILYNYGPIAPDTGDVPMERQAFVRYKP